MKKSQRRFPHLSWTIQWVFLIVSFSLIGFSLVTMAMGYRFNPHTHRYQKTGMIIVSNPPKDSYLLIDGKQQPLKQGANRIPNVLPGHYRLVIGKDGYLPREEQVTIEPGYVVTLPDIELFLAEPRVITDNPDYEELLPFYNVPDNQLRLVDGELRQGTRLITRFSNPPSRVLLLPSGRHVAYLRDNEIRLIETNGEHDILLYSGQNLSDDAFAAIDDVLVFRENGQLKGLVIR